MSAAGPIRGEEPIAIIGIGCRFAEARGPRELWDLICSGESAVREVPEHRIELGYDIEHFHDPRPRLPGKISTRKAGFLDHPELFDPLAVGLSPRDAVSMETQQRVMIEVTWDALEDAGIPPDSLQGERVAVMIGQMAEDYSREHIAVLGEEAFHRGLDVFGVAGLSRAVLSGRISFLLGVTGPSFTLDTACSSSLFTTHLACQSLWNGESTLALAGGVNIFLTPEGNIALSRSGMLAGDGQCKAFDASADGFVRAEGAGMVVLRPLRAALAAGDPIYAVIRGSGISADGRDGGHMMAPGRLGQAQAMRDAYARAGIAPSQIHYVETHGTGTVIGDPVELGALADVMGPGRAKDQPLLVASVKGTLGHAESASGVAGLIKAALCVHHRELPPQLHFREPSPHIPWDELPIRVQTEHTPWPYPGPARAGVNSFGISGTNAHVVLESAPERERPARVASARPYLLPISGHTPRALEEMAERYRDWLRAADGPPLEDVAYTLGQRRSHRSQRLCVVGRSREELLAELDAFLAPGTVAGPVRGIAEAGRVPAVAFVFPGQGAQWAGMGRQLLDEESAFRESLEAWDAAFKPHVPWSLIDVLRSADADALLARLDIVQPVLIAFNAALADLWQSFGVTPDMVIGQSLGEISAACVAGHLDREEAARLACQRGAQVARASGRGGMGIVGLPAEDVEALLADYAGRVEVAGVNSPLNTIVSGDRDAVTSLLETLSAREIFARPLNVDFASHCFHMDPLLADFADAIGVVTPLAGPTPYFSTVTGTQLAGEALTSDYWVRNLRSPVQLAPAIREAILGGAEIFVEMSPHPALSQSLRDIANALAKPVTSVAPLRRDQDESRSLRCALSELFVRGIPLDFAAIQDPGEVVRAPLYAYQRERYWFGTRRRKHLQRRDHPLRGLAVESSTDPSQRFYESTLDADVLPFVADVELAGIPQQNPALFIETALAVAADRAPGANLALRELELMPSIPLPEGNRFVLQAVLRELQAQSDLQISCRATDPDARWSPLLRCQIETQPKDLEAPGANLDAIKQRCSFAGTSEVLYRELEASGLVLARSLRTIRELYLGDAEALGWISLHHSAAPEAAAYHAHPALLTGCFQVICAALARQGAPGALAVSRIENLTLSTELGPELWCHVELRPAQEDPEIAIADLTLLRPDGRCAGRIEGLRGRRAARRTTASSLYEIGWQPLPELALCPEAPRAWQVVAEHAADGPPIAAALETLGCSAVVRSLDDFQRNAGSASAGLEGVALVSSHQTPSDALAHASPMGEDPVVSLLLQLVQHGAARRVAVLTRRLQPVGDTPAVPRLADAQRWAVADDLARRAGAPHCVRIDLDDSSAPDAIARALLAPAREARLALRDDVLFAARLQELTVGSGVRGESALEAAAGRPFAARLVPGNDLDAVALREASIPKPSAGEVRIEVRAAALSFLDLLGSLGRDDEASSLGLGLECAGIVRELGPDSHGLEPGDAVFGFAPGAVATDCVTRADLLARKPGGVSFEQAAALPLAFATAHLALRAAHVQPGETLLIHSASSAVGLAAIQLARRQGALVLATAGSPRRRKALEALGVSRVAPSRSLDFADAIKSWTHGRGVDIVLDARATGSAPESAALLAPGGRLIDLRTSEPGRSAALDLRCLEHNRSYASIDLQGILRDRPAELAPLLRETARALSAGQIEPLPTQAFRLAHAGRALRFIAQDRQFGKVVLRVEDRALTPIEVEGHGEFDLGQGAVLICGANLEEQRLVATWLAERGVREIGLLCDAEPDARSLDAVPGCARSRVAILRGSADPASAIEKLEGSGQPLCGAVYVGSGTLLRDAPGSQPEIEADAARQLHLATRGRDLRFFGLITRADPILAMPAQTGSAHGIFDFIAQQRRSEGLRAARIAITSAGSASGARYADAFVSLLSESRDALLSASALGASDLPENAVATPFFQALGLSNAAAGSGFRDELLTLDGEPRRERMLAVVADAVAGVLALGAEARENIDLHLALNRLGLDSLMGLELRVGLERDLGIEIPPSFFVEGPSIRELCELLLERLDEKLEART